MMSEPPQIPPPPNSISPGQRSPWPLVQGSWSKAAPSHSAPAPWVGDATAIQSGGKGALRPVSPRMPTQLQIQRIMLFLMPAWTVLMLPSLIWWENIHLFGIWDMVLAFWLALPGAAALTCGLLLRSGGTGVLYAILGLCAAIVALDIWFFRFGGPPVLQAIPFTVLTAIPLCFPSSWRYARLQRECRRFAAEINF